MQESREIDQIIAKKLYIKFSDSVIVHGEYAKKTLNITNKCYSIPHGDYSFFLNFQKKKLKEEENTILFFGTIKEYKGLDYLIKAVNKIDKYHTIKLIIAGEGDFDKYCNIISNKNNFEIHNRYINDAEVPEFFQRAKIVVLPYTESTQTGIIPIAYSFKKPVIVTRVGSIPEVVDEGKTGLIVPSENLEALENAIVKLLNNDNLRNEMGENAYNKMKAELSWEKISDNLNNIYNKIIESKK